MDDAEAKLLLKAVRALPRGEQDRVLAALVREAFGEPWRPVSSASSPDVVFSYPSRVPMPAPALGGPGHSTMLPVRLPPELHERLRRWSTEQGFSMAGIVRGLVERFLDQQAGSKPATRPATPAKRPATPAKPRPKPRRKPTTARG